MIDYDPQLKLPDSLQARLYQLENALFYRGIGVITQTMCAVLGRLSYDIVHVLLAFIFFLCSSCTRGVEEE